MDVPLKDVARLIDPQFYGSRPHETYSRLRKEEPVFWCESANAWGISKYEDVRYVSRHPELFSSAYGLMVPLALLRDDVGFTGPGKMPRMAELRQRAQLAYMGEGTEWIVASDPPRHAVIRRIVSHAFNPRRIASLEGPIRRLVGDLLDQVKVEEPTEAMSALAVPLPIYVIAEVLGLPREDWEKVWRWTDAQVEAINDLADASSGNQVTETMMEFAIYLFSALAERRDSPRDDLLTAIGQAEADGERLTEANQLMALVTLLFAGNDTTRALLAGAIELLAEHPAQRRRLVQQPDLIPKAVEELLRYVCPVQTFCRTATEDTVLRGQTIARGDYVILLYDSANRDEEIWTSPQVFDVAREPDPGHVAFGYGEHYCLGARLAVLETRIFLEELLGRFPDFELAGEILRSPTAHIVGTTDLPVVFRETSSALVP